MLAELLKNHPKVLAECAIAERLRRSPEVTLHPTLYNTPLIYGPEDARRKMASLYQEYLAEASKNHLPLLLTAPTWRLDADRIANAGVPASINADAVEFLIATRDATHPPSSAPVLVGALTGPKNDCYQPHLAPDTAAAEQFHSQQITQLDSTGADFLLAQTLPSVAEALGIARAMAATNKPYIISFCTGTDGHVLDGTSLPDAMEKIDADGLLKRRPVGYFVNCTHPQFLLNAYPDVVLERLIGIQANASSRDVTTLDGSGVTESDPIDNWTRSMLELHDRHAVQVLGGCCGTALAHMQRLAGG